MNTIKITPFFFALALILLASCTKQTTPSKSPVSNSASRTADGLSYESAVVIQEKTEMKGIKTEYAWLAEHYPGYKLISQSLSTYGDKPYDIITIKTKKGEKKQIYFDISKFYGKF